MFASYTGPLFKALRASDKKEQDIGVAADGFLDLNAFNTFCSGTTCQPTTLYDQTANKNDLWRGDQLSNQICCCGGISTGCKAGSGFQTCNNCPCALLDLGSWQMKDGSKVPMAVKGSGAHCLRNRDRTKGMPKGADPQTTYGVFHTKYTNNSCCFDYGNTEDTVRYGGRNTMSAITISTGFKPNWTWGTGSGPWPFTDFETGVYTGDDVTCGGLGTGDLPANDPRCGTGLNPTPSITYEIVTVFGKHNGVDKWGMKVGDAKGGAGANLTVSIPWGPLPPNYGPLQQMGGLSLGEGGSGDPGGNGAFSEGMVIKGMTDDATDDAIQKSIVSVFSK